jgi:hypothetical protein
LSYEGEYLNTFRGLHVSQHQRWDPSSRHRHFIQ